jgi:putative FmdB family regulatory protein
VPTYSFRCPVCGPFDLVRPMAHASDPPTCPGCGGTGRRLWAVPALRELDPALRRALDAGARSSDAPDVVSAVPGRRAPRYTTDPRHARLPRP